MTWWETSSGFGEGPGRERSHRSRALPGADTARPPGCLEVGGGEGAGERGRFPGTEVGSRREREVTLEVSPTQKERTGLGAARRVWQRLTLPPELE